MNAARVDEINTERLDGWRRELLLAHATALVLVGLGHDHRIGELHIHVPEVKDMPDVALAQLLRAAADRIEASA